MTRSSLRRPIWRPRPGSAPVTFRPQLERLEDRTVPSTVANLLDGGPGSLRDAIANTPVGGVVDFQPGLTGTITLTSGALTIGNDLAINGPGAGILTVSGDQESTVFDITGGTVAMSGLTVADGAAVGGELGGGIANNGDLSLTDLVVTGNSSAAVPNGIFNSGGGIDNQGQMTITDCVVSGNTSPGGGGGIQNRGALTVADSTLTGNSAGYGGGGIANLGTMTVESSTFSGNSAGNTGGAIWTFDSMAYNGQTLVVSCTFNGNSATSGGALSSNMGNVTLSSSTISGNTASADGGGIVGDVGQLANTLIAGNQAASAPDLSGTVGEDQGNNLIGDGDGGSGFVASDLVGTAAQPIDPLLGPLQDNGGPMPTMALLPGSPAIDAGDNAATPGLYDQRGPGYPRIVNGTIDIGAFESNILAVQNNNDSGAGSLRQAILDANGTPGNYTISFVPGVAGVISLDNPLPTLSGDIDLEGPGALRLTVQPSSGDKFGVFTVGSGAVVTLAGLTIADGTAASGGILNDGGTLTVRDCAVAGSSGGGIDNASGTLTISDSTIAGNSGPNGGGIVNAATLTLRNSTIADNTATGGGSGGGIDNTGTLTVSSCTIAGNTASGAGGGVFNGGAGTATINNTLVAQNQAPTGPDAAGAFVSQGHNLIGDGDGGSGFVATDLVGTSANPIDPQLRPLQNNGGQTSTLALLPGSPAIDAGDDASPPGLYDQRGEGFPRIANGVIDIGAFEFQVTPPTIFVLNTNDAGAGSLRQAILDADALPGDTIVAFVPGVTGTINLVSALPDLSSNIDLEGPGPANLAVENNSVLEFGIFQVENGAAVTLSGMTIGGVENDDGTVTVNDCALGGLSSCSWEDLTVSDCSFGGFGGVTISTSPLGTGGVISIDGCTFSNDGVGITLDAGTMTVSNCTIHTGEVGISSAGTLTVSDCTIQSCEGGGVSNTGTATIDNCTIAKNNFTADGGGVYNTGTLSITNSTIAGNSAGLPGSGSGGSGGGIYNTGTLIITNSTVAGNSAEGAWIAVPIGHGQQKIVPTAPAVGGGIWNSGTLTVASCTIAYNTAVQALGPDIGSNGGGVASVGGTATVQNTIIAQNQSPADPDASGSFVSRGHNLVGAGNGSSGFGAGGDQVGSAAAPINPLLGPLQNNGGPTQTMALLPGSPALDAGDDSLSPGPTTSAAPATPASSMGPSTSAPSSRQTRTPGANSSWSPRTSPCGRRSAATGSRHLRRGPSCRRAPPRRRRGWGPSPWPATSPCGSSSAAPGPCCRPREPSRRSAPRRASRCSPCRPTTPCGSIRATAGRSCRRPGPSRRSAPAATPAGRAWPSPWSGTRPCGSTTPPAPAAVRSRATAGPCCRRRARSCRSAPGRTTTCSRWPPTSRCGISRAAAGRCCPRRARSCPSRPGPARPAPTWCSRWRATTPCGSSARAAGGCCPRREPSPPSTTCPGRLPVGPAATRSTTGCA